MNFVELPCKISRKRLVTDSFEGLNFTPSIKENELSGGLNLTSCDYPALSVRAPLRELPLSEPSDIVGMLEGEGPVWVQGNKVFCGGREVCGLVLTDGEKSLAAAGKYMYIFPDKVWVDTKELTFGYMERSASVDEGVIIITPALKEYSGAEYIESATEPEVKEPESFEGKFWLDSSSIPCRLKKYVYNGESGSFVEVTPDCFRLIAANADGSTQNDFYKGFEAGDGLTFSATGQMKNALASLGLLSTFVLLENGQTGQSGYMIFDFKITGHKNQVLTSDALSGSFRLERKVPDLDLVLMGRERLWGCNIKENKIYGSRRGAFSSWYGQSMSASDPICLDAASPGEFTGGALYIDTPLFFKEDYIHKVLEGSQIVTKCPGIKAGCKESARLVKNTLFYMSREGVCAYSGNLPEVVSKKLGAINCDKAASCVCGELYYLSLSDKTTYVCDTSRNIWHCVDIIPIEHSASCQGICYYSNKNRMFVMGSDSVGIPFENKICWWAELGDFVPKTGDMKELLGIEIRCETEVGGEIYLRVMYDNDGNYVFAGRARNGVCRIMLNRRRCDRLKIRLEGVKGCKIYSIVRIYRAVDVLKGA